MMKMKKEELRIIYMGTPDFAVEPLRKLVEGGYNVVAVVTMPDKPAGRGHKIQFSAVKEYALSVDIPLLQPEKLKNEDFITELRSYKADLQIVVAFRMLPEIVWNMPRLGTFNLHASLLPQYRGAAPINWAIINGERETGVTTFFLEHEIDTGNIILQQKIEISENDNVGVIHDKLMYLGADVVLKTVDMILADQIMPKAQDDIIKEENISLKAAPKIFKETCKIDWNQSPKAVHNFIRGLAPYPVAWTDLLMSDGETIRAKVYAAEPIVKDHNFEVGSIVQLNKEDLNVAVNGGYVALKVMQLPGKKRMPVADLLRGFTIDENCKMK